MSVPDATLDFPRLNPDTAESCPVSLDDIQSYLKLEDGDGETDRDLRFLRTALAFGSRYWIWEYRLCNGTHCYATVELNSRGFVTTGMDWDTERFSPEQYIGDQRRRTQS